VPLSAARSPPRSPFCATMSVSLSPRFHCPRVLMARADFHAKRKAHAMGKTTMAKTKVLINKLWKIWQNAGNRWGIPCNQSKGGLKYLLNIFGKCILYIVYPKSCILLFFIYFILFFLYIL